MGARFSTACGGLLLAVWTASAAAQTIAVQPGPAQTPPGSAQTAPDTSATSTDVDKLPISLDRIREQLAREPAFSANLLRALDIPVFRTETKSDLVFRPDPRWWKDDDVGSYVRPTVNRWQYDFMKMTNPNLPTGYGPGGGADVLPAIQSAFSGIRHAFQAREAAQVRQQIQEELRAINEARRAAGLPPADETPASTTPAQRQP
jgi:hypothetical protein